MGCQSQECYGKWITSGTVSEVVSGGFCEQWLCVEGYVGGWETIWQGSCFCVSVGVDRGRKGKIYVADLFLEARLPRRARSCPFTGQDPQVCAAPPKWRESLARCAFPTQAAIAIEFVVLEPVSSKLHSLLLLLR